MERALVDAAAWRRALLEHVHCPECGSAFALAAALAVLMGTLTAGAGAVANTTVVQTVALLLARGLPF